MEIALCLVMSSVMDECHLRYVCEHNADCVASLCVILLLFSFLHRRTDKYTVRKRRQPEMECSPSAIQQHTAVTLAHMQCHALCNHLVGGPNLAYIWDFCHKLYIGGNLCVYEVGGSILFVSLLVAGRTGGATMPTQMQ